MIELIKSFGDLVPSAMAGVVGGALIAVAIVLATSAAVALLFHLAWYFS